MEPAGPPRPGVPTGRPPADRLDSWKEIAAYLKRDVRTTQRWEKHEGLPVHRHTHSRLASVYAYRDEIDAWWNSRRKRLESQAKVLAARRRRLKIGIAAAAVLGVAAVFAVRERGGGVGEAPQMVARRLWSGPDAGRLFAVSPDGRYLAYMNKTADAFAVREIATGREKYLASEKYPSHAGEASSAVFSPDGTEVAYSWFNELMFYDLRVVGVGGGKPRVLYRDPAVFPMEVTDWSPTGNLLLACFHRRDQTGKIVLISVADGSVRVLKSIDQRKPLRMAFSPGGDSIAYDFPSGPASSDHDIMALQIGSRSEESREFPLVRHPANDVLLAWAEDGKSLLFASDRTDTLDAWAIRVVSGRPSGEPRLVKKDLGRIWPIGVTRSGFFYYVLQIGLEDVYVAELDVEAGKMRVAPASASRRFAGANRSPDWSPDGRSLAFISQRIPPIRYPGARLIIRSLHSSVEREILPDLNSVDQIRWSPDGRSFLMNGTDRSDLFGLFLVDARTGAVTPVDQRDDPKAFFHMPAWSADGKAVLYKLRDWGVEPARLLVRHLTTGKEGELLPSVYRYDVSPDGKSLAFSTFDQSGEYLRIVPVAGGRPREIYRQPRGAGRIYSVVWTKDGRSLLFSKRGELWKVSSERGEPHRFGLAMEGLRELRLHPDGRQLAFTAGAGKGEVWVLENILPNTEARR